MLKLASGDNLLTLTGLDISAAMLAKARAELPASVRLLQGRLERLPMEDASFDAVTCFNALHFCAMPEAVLNEFHRVLAPDGRLVIVDWRRDWLMMPLLDKWLRMNKRPMGRLLRMRELATLAREVGLAVDAMERFRIRPAWALMTMRAHRTP